MTKTTTERLNELLEEGLEHKLYSGVALAVLNSDDVLYQACRGSLSFEDKTPVDETTLFDLASLTKILCTTPLALQALGEGKMRLSQPIYQLLTHTSGLPAHVLLQDAVDSPDEVEDFINKLETVYEPGEHVVYSCMGFIRLGFYLQHLLGGSLDELLETRIKARLGLKRLGYNPQTKKVCHTRDLSTGEELAGTVHDENARFLGGVSANAGLFGDLEELSLYAQTYLRGGEPLVNPWVLKRAQVNETPNLEEHRGLGFYLGSTKHSSLGDFAAGGFGHTGFTGTSMLIMPEDDLAIVYLSNRVLADNDGSEALDLRARVHNVILTSTEFRGKP